MWRYVVKRLLWLVVIMLCVALMIFTIMWFVPGDPARLILGNGVTDADVQALRDQMGLNDPFLVQLGRYMYDTFIKFDLGMSYSLKAPVIDEFVKRLPRTLGLGIISVCINILVGIPIGINCALHHNTLRDRSLLVGSMALISVPQFWLALMMVILFTRELGWLPGYGIDSWKCWIMPVIANSVSGIAMNARQTRSAVLETIRADFVTTAKAKGLPHNKVIYKHMLPNAMIPIVNSLGGQLAMIVSGTVVIESVFTFPGIGLYMLSGINARDYPVIRSCVLILALFSAIITLLVDITYGYLDPRIKAQFENYAAKKGGR